MPTPRRIGRATIALAALVPPAVIAVAVATHARNVPWWDQWAQAPFMLAAIEGYVPGWMLWAAVNEHRIPVTLVVQGAVAWATRWDIRGDAWTNVAIAMGSLVFLAALARRSLGSGAPLVTVACSVLVFSPIAGASWTAGWITPAFLAAFFACVLAWLVAGTSGTWLQLGAMLLAACAGALSFGSGTVLVGLVPLAVLLMPATFARRRQHALAAMAVGLALGWVYLLGWAPRQPAFRVGRLAEYIEYALAFVGGGIGARPVATATAWGAGLVGAWAAASIWLWVRRRDLRPALVPWGVLALYAIGNGLITAVGRLDNGLNIAIRPRYTPTACLLTASVSAVAALLVADVRARSRAAGWIARVTLATLVLAVAWTFIPAARGGFDEMAKVARHLDSRAECLRWCMRAPDVCFTRICWDPMLARRMCLRLKVARAGPFRLDAPAR